MKKIIVQTDKNNDGKIKASENKAEIKGEKIDVNGKEKSASELSLDMSDLKINKQTIDLLVANVIPTTKYFESRFDHMQFQVDRINQDINEFKTSIEKSFEQVDQRFEKVDQRFEKVDQRFESIISSIDRLADKLDGRDERQRNFTIKMFTISISISILGVMGAFPKSLGII